MVVTLFDGHWLYKTQQKHSLNYYKNTEYVVEQTPNTSIVAHSSMVGRRKLFWKFSLAFFAILSFLVYLHVILVLTVLAYFSFSFLQHSRWVRSIFILIFHVQFFFSYYRSSVSFAMFHPVIVTVGFSDIYLVSHIHPSSSWLTLHHDCLNPSVTNQTATSQFK